MKFDRFFKNIFDKIKEFVFLGTSENLVSLNLILSKDKYSTTLALLLNLVSKFKAQSQSISYFRSYFRGLYVHILLFLCHLEYP